MTDMQVKCVATFEDGSEETFTLVLEQDASGAYDMSRIAGMTQDTLELRSETNWIAIDLNIKRDV